MLGPGKIFLSLRYHFNLASPIRLNAALASLIHASSSDEDHRASTLFPCSTPQISTMKRFFSWIRRRPEPEPVQDGVLSAEAVDPLTSSKLSEKIHKDEGISDNAARLDHAVTKKIH